MSTNARYLGEPQNERQHASPLLNATIPGRARPKADPTIGRGGDRLIMAPGTRREQQRVADIIRRAAHDQGLTELLPLPLGTPVSVRVHITYAGASAGDPIIRTPDIDKVCRLIGDALTWAGVLTDDAQICSWSADRRIGYADQVEISLSLMLIPSALW